jgi:type IV pilus assembly protein PilO
MHVNLRSPTTQKWIIVCVLLFGATYGFYNFVYTPRRELEKKLDLDVQKEADLLARGKRIAANYQTVRDDYARLMKSWEMAHELLPTQKEMEGLLKNVTLEGQERDISFLLFKPLDPVEHPYYWENPIQVRTLSTYHKLGDFLSSIAAMDRIVNVGRLKMNAARNVKGRNPQTVEAEFLTTIYIFKDLGVPTSTQAAADAKAAVTPQTANDDESSPLKKAQGRQT